MVELSDPKGPYKEGIDNTIFIVPGIIILLLIAFCVYKLVKSLKDKLKSSRREKEAKAAKKRKRKSEKRQIIVASF